MEIKKIIAAFLAAVSAMSGCGKNEEAFTSAEEKPIEQDYKGFIVSGNKLLDANGEEFIMRGINHSHTWFKKDTKTAVPAIAETGANTVRIVLSNGYQWQKDTADEVVDVVELCKENKLVTILEVHDGTGKDDPAVLDEIADYWIEIKDVLIGNEDSVILNIANEWYGQWGGKEWAQAYISVIPKIREAGIRNTIMVDSAGWGQYGQSVADYGKQIFEADELRNTMFSIHMYGSAGGSKAKIRKNIDGALDKGLCLIIGEFGYNHSDGDVDEQFIMDYCTEKKVGYLGWSWKGNSGGVEYLDIAKDWKGSVLSEDWGEILINGKNGIRETSQLCSIFKK